MYEKLDSIILELENDDERTNDEWYDFALDDAIDCVNRFKEEDWNKLYLELPSKSLNWKKRLNECMDPNEEHQLKVIEYLANIEDIKLFSDIVYKLLPFDIYKLENPNLLLEKAEELLPLVDKYNQINYSNFLEKKTISK